MVHVDGKVAAFNTAVAELHLDGLGCPDMSTVDTEISRLDGKTIIAKPILAWWRKDLDLSIELTTDNRREFAAGKVDGFAEADLGSIGTIDHHQTGGLRGNSIGSSWRLIVSLLDKDRQRVEFPAIRGKLLPILEQQHHSLACLEDFGLLALPRVFVKVFGPTHFLGLGAGDGTDGNRSGVGGFHPGNGDDSVAEDQADEREEDSKIIAKEHRLGKVS